MVKQMINDTSHNKRYATQCPLFCPPHLIFFPPLINLWKALNFLWSPMNIRTLNVGSGFPARPDKFWMSSKGSHKTHPLLLENVPLWASQGFFISGELKRFYPGGIFTILKESKLNMTKYLNRNPAAGSWCRILQEKN